MNAKRKISFWAVALSLALMLALAVTSLGLAAELVTAELAAPINDVTVTQGTSASFTISVSATGAIKCTATSSTPATATVHTAYSLDSVGSLTSGTPSSALSFFAGAPGGGPNNCDVTWTGAPTPYAVSASVSAAATTPVGTYTITLSPGAGTTTVTTPSGPGGSLADGTATTITVHVVAPPNTAPTSPGIPGLSSGSNPNNTGEFTLSWDASTDTETPASITYLLEHKDANDASYSMVASGLTTNSYTFTSGSPEAEGTWVYRVQASDGSLTSAFSGDSTPIVVDKSAPNAPTASASTSDGPYTSDTWTNKDVTVSFTANGDPNLADGSAGSDAVTCTASSTLTAETSGTTVSGTCMDAAGNTSAAASVTVMIDKTAPNAPSLSPDRSPEYSGGGEWYKDTVTISFSDNGDAGTVQSGVNPSSVPSAITFNTSGSHTASGTVMDYANNTSLSAGLTVQVDADKPTVNITCPSSPVILGSSASASWTASDAHSGLATASSGSVALDTSSVGSKTATAPTAMDNVGHASDPETCSYSVIYNWNGFFAPVDNPGPGPTYVFNRVKAGSAIPVKFSLGGNQGLSIFDTGYPKSALVSCSTAGGMDDIEQTVTAGSSSLSYDATIDQYIYVWKTDKAWGGTCRKLTVRLIDGTEHIAYFNFTK